MYRFQGHTTGSSSFLKKPKVFTKIDFLKVRFLYKTLMLGVFIVILSLFYIWSRIQVIQTVYDINKLNEELSVIQIQNRQFQVESAVLKSPKRLEKIVKEKFKMNMPTPKKIQHN